MSMHKTMFYTEFPFWHLPSKSLPYHYKLFQLITHHSLGGGLVILDEI